LEALSPLLQLAAALNDIFWLAQECPAPLVTSRAINGEAFEEHRLEADCQPPQHCPIDTHRNIVDEPFVGHCGVIQVESATIRMNEKIYYEPWK
jgi:hypothetical protein